MELIKSYHEVSVQFFTITNRADNNGTLPTWALEKFEQSLKIIVPNTVLYTFWILIIQQNDSMQKISIVSCRCNRYRESKERWQLFHMVISLYLNTEKFYEGETILQIILSVL